MVHFDKFNEEFNQLFEELTGIKPENAVKGEDLFLFIPPEAKLSEKDENKRKRLTELAGPNGWRNHLVNNEYAGWWIRPPLWNTDLVTECCTKDFEEALFNKFL